MPSRINNAPEEIEIPIMKKIKNFFFGIGFFLGLLGVFAYSASDYGPMVILALMALASFYVGSLLKTTKKAVGQSTIYR